MTSQLRAAFAAAAALSPAAQDALALEILSAIESDRRWDAAFASTPPDKLARLAERAVAEHRAGKTERMSCDDD